MTHWFAHSDHKGMKLADPKKANQALLEALKMNFKDLKKEKNDPSTGYRNQKTS